MIEIKNEIFVDASFELSVTQESCNTLVPSFAGAVPAFKRLFWKITMTYRRFDTFAIGVGLQWTKKTKSF